jgi:GMP synthase-like glutamine amidotransferase
MRVGLLLCDHVRPEVLHIGGDYPDFFASLLPDLDLVPYDLAEGVFPGKAAECDAWLATGSRRSVYEDEPWIRRLAELVRNFANEPQPFLGICFGAQMIGHALGGEVRRAASGWAVGMHEVEVIDSQPWMVPPARSYRLLHSNGDQIVRMPPGSKLLGRSPQIPVSLLAVGETVVGFQGHPEFSNDYAAALLGMRRGVLIPEEVVDAGLQTLAVEPDRPLLASWLRHFLSGKTEWTGATSS